jgi:uncharacterized protein YgbK (DUF1537 family)
VESDINKSVEQKSKSLEQQDEGPQKVKSNETVVQSLQEHINHMAGVCKAETQKNEQLLQAKEELFQRLASLESQYLAQVEKTTTMEQELVAAKKLLLDERLVTEQLEKIRESSKKHSLLQEKKIILLNDKLEETMAAKDGIEGECDGHEFILYGERRLRQQAQDLQNEFEKNYITLSSGFHSLKLEQANTRVPSVHQESPARAVEDVQNDCPEGESHLDNLLTVMNDSCESGASIFYDVEDEASENKPLEESRKSSNLEARLARSTEELETCDQDQQATQQTFIWADNTVQQGELSTSSSSAASYASSTNIQKLKVAEGADGVVISNMDDMASFVSGSCQTAGFSIESAEQAEFFLPNLSPAGPYEHGVRNSEMSDASICDLKSILRPWQVDFLASLRIKTAGEFVEIHTKDGCESSLARKMRRWRRKQKLPSVKTRSCAIALLIWARTCKKVDRFFQNQIKAGNAHPKRPDFLDVCPSGSRSMSSLGFGSMIVDPKNQMEV